MIPNIETEAVAIDIILTEYPQAKSITPEWDADGGLHAVVELPRGLVVLYTHEGRRFNDITKFMQFSFKERSVNKNV